MKIGVLALQGAFVEHIRAMEALGVTAVAVRLPVELEGLDGLIIPGGESTTMLNLMRSYGLTAPLKERAGEGLAIWGTCAGMICLAKQVTSPDSLETLALMDMAVKRNAFGRQVDSFEAALPVAALGEPPFTAVFIRAPVIERVSPPVEVLARLPDGVAVAARQGRLLATAFHPELTADRRFHGYFLEIIASSG